LDVARALSWFHVRFNGATDVPTECWESCRTAFPFYQSRKRNADTIKACVRLEQISDRWQQTYESHRA